MENKFTFHPSTTSPSTETLPASFQVVRHSHLTYHGLSEWEFKLASVSLVSPSFLTKYFFTWETGNLPSLHVQQNITMKFRTVTCSAMFKWLRQLLQMFMKEVWEGDYMGYLSKILWRLFFWRFRSRHDLSLTVSAQFPRLKAICFIYSVHHLQFIPKWLPKKWKESSTQFSLCFGDSMKAPITYFILRYGLESCGSGLSNL